MANSVVCHLGKPRTAKPETQHEYGQMRVRMIQSPWVALSEQDFLWAVTVRGCPFYTALMQGSDLMEFQSEKAVWRTQSFFGLDFDKCDIGSREAISLFENQGLEPWAAYHTFGNNPKVNGGESFRLLWRVEADLNLTYDECSAALKEMRRVSYGRADKYALNPTRLFQGTNFGTLYWDTHARKLDLKELAQRFNHQDTKLK